jgi:hypothetical protein
VVVHVSKVEVLAIVKMQLVLGGLIGDYASNRALAKRTHALTVDIDRAPCGVFLLL